MTTNQGQIADISSEEILQDIRETEAEIAVMKREEQGLRMVGDRMSVFRADARLTGIQERSLFIGKLKAILAERGKEIE